MVSGDDHGMRPGVEATKLGQSSGRNTLFVPENPKKLAEIQESRLDHSLSTKVSCSRVGAAQIIPSRGMIINHKSIQIVDGLFFWFVCCDWDPLRTVI